MIQINSCTLTPNAKQLYIDAQIIDNDWFENVNLDSVYVDTDQTFVSTGVSSSPIYSKTSIGGKNVQLSFDVDGISNMLFFVYVTAAGEASDDAPCDMKQKQVLAIAYDRRLLYRNAASFLNDINGCSPSDYFKDYILRVKAFEIALKTCNYEKAIELWREFIHVNKGKTTFTSTCGCHG